AGLLVHLAVISPEQIVTPRVAKSKLDWPPFELQGRTGARATLGLTRTNALPPEGRQPPTVSLGRNHDFECIECEVEHTSCVPNGNAVGSSTSMAAGARLHRRHGLGHSPAWLIGPSGATLGRRPDYSITSSARPSSDSGKVRPNASPSNRGDPN